MKLLHPAMWHDHDIDFVIDSATFLWISRGEGIVSNRRPHTVPDRVDRDESLAGCLMHIDPRTASSKGQ